MSDTRSEIIDIQNQWDKEMTLKEQFEQILTDSTERGQLNSKVAVNALIQAVEASLPEKKEFSPKELVEMTDDPDTLASLHAIHTGYNAAIADMRKELV